MFLNDLFTITYSEQINDVVSAEIKLSENHKIFAGHFPQTPILPGVMQIQIVKEILEQHLNRELQLKNMLTCKFLRIIDPAEIPILNFTIKFVQQEFLVATITGTTGTDIFLKAQISYI